jgi:hypothetical protein
MQTCRNSAGNPDTRSPSHSWPALVPQAQKPRLDLLFRSGDQGCICTSRPFAVQGSSPRTSCFQVPTELARSHGCSRRYSTLQARSVMPGMTGDSARSMATALDRLAAKASLLCGGAEVRRCGGAEVRRCGGAGEHAKGGTPGRDPSDSVGALYHWCGPHVLKLLGSGGEGREQQGMSGSVSTSRNGGRSAASFSQAVPVALGHGADPHLGMKGQKHCTQGRRSGADLQQGWITPSPAFAVAGWIAQNCAGTGH